MLRITAKSFAIVVAVSLLLGTAVMPVLAKETATPKAKVDLNTATEDQLIALPGVGAATAKKIIAARPYTSVADLSKAGLSGSVIQKITPYVTVGASSVSKSTTPAQKKEKATTTKAGMSATSTVDLNTATEDQLIALPGVGAASAKKIIAARPYASVADLSKAGLSASVIQKITPYVTVGANSVSESKTPAPKTEKATTPKKMGTSATTAVDLNSATEDQLEALPGVGVVTAKKIVSGRPYKSMGDLSKAGLTASEIRKITPFVTVAAGSTPESTAPVPAIGKATTTKKAATPAATVVDLNTATEDQLVALPGVGEVNAKKIIAGRPYKSVADLSKAGVSESVIQKVAPLVTVSQKTTEEEETAYQPPPAKGMVWVNLNTKVYHQEGDRWYGRTKNGKYMTEADAIKAGYRAAKEPGKKPQ